MVAGHPVILQSSVRSGSDYGVTVSLTDNSQAILVTGSTLTIWGVPADPSHDPFRGVNCLNGDNGGSLGSCPAGVPPKPYLTLPTSCAGPQTFKINVDSWASPGLWGGDSFLTHDSSGNPVGFEGCEHLSLTPEVSVKPTIDQASTPSGLDFKIDIADEGLTAPGGLAQSQIKKTIVTLPEGVTVNPSAGEGLGACTPSDYHRETAESAPGAGCPNSSKIGEVTIESALLSQPVKGSLFLAEPYENPFPEPQAGHPNGSLLAVYIVAKLPDRGLVIKSAGKVEPDPVTGQLTTTFDNIPQLPFSSFRAAFPRRPERAAGHPTRVWHVHHAGVVRAVVGREPQRTRARRSRARDPVLHDHKGVHEGPCPIGWRAAVQTAGHRGHAEQRRGLLQPVLSADRPRRRRTGDHALLDDRCRPG